MLQGVTDNYRGAGHAAEMVRKRQLRRNFIRQWREFRGLTQEQLAERMGVARSYVSHVENGNRRYDQPFLEAAADALLCEPADLIMRDPSKPGAIWSIWDQIPLQERDQAARILETFARRKVS